MKTKQRASVIRLFPLYGTAFKKPRFPLEIPTKMISSRGSPLEALDHFSILKPYYVFDLFIQSSDVAD